MSCQYNHSNLYCDIIICLATNIDLLLRSSLTLCEIEPWPFNFCFLFLYGFFVCIARFYSLFILHFTVFVTVFCFPLYSGEGICFLKMYLCNFMLHLYVMDVVDTFLYFQAVLYILCYFCCM